MGVRRWPSRQNVVAAVCGGVAAGGCGGSRSMIAAAANGGDGATAWRLW